MRKPEPIDSTVGQWRACLERGETVVIEQSPWFFIRYLVLTVVMTALCAWVVTIDDGWWLTWGAGYAGLVLFGLIGIPVLTFHALRGKEPRVRIDRHSVSVGDTSMPRSEITSLRIHDGSYNPTTAEAAGGVSLFRGEEHALEIPLPPSIPTGAIERILLTDR